MTRESIVRIALAAGVACITLSPAAAQGAGGMGRGGRGRQPAVTGPWGDSKKSPDEGAELTLKEMTLDEKITIVHGGGRGFGGSSWNLPLSSAAKL